MNDRDWTAWSPGDQVEIDSEGRPWHGEVGRVTGLDDPEDAIYGVRLDTGEEVTAYGYELTGTTAAPSEASTK